jgi:hypothetical protein
MASERRLSELARHLVQPSDIATSDFPRIQRVARKAGIEYDLWQQGLATLLFGRKRDKQYAAGIGGAVISICRQVGKTFTVGSCIFILCILARGLKVLWTAHRSRTSDETFKSMTAIANNKLLKRYVSDIRRANGQQEIRFANGSRIMFGAREQGFGRGFDDVDIEIFDEAQILTERALDDMIPATNVAANPLIIFMGTPPKPGDPSEVFEEKRRDALAGVDGMLYIEFSADRDADPDDREQWRKANPSYPKRTSEAAILRMRNLLGADSFRREGLGIWDETTSISAIDAQQWKDSVVQTRAAGGWNAIGVDMPPDRGSLAIGACRAWNDGNAHIELAMFRDTKRYGVAWAVDWIAERWPRMAAVVIDAQSPATVLVPDLKRRGVRITLTGPTDMGQAVGRFQDMLRDHKLRHLQQAPLDIAVSGCTLRKIGQAGAMGWNKLGSDVDISPLVAATLALHGATTSHRRPETTQRIVRLP